MSEPSNERPTGSQLPVLQRAHDDIDAGRLWKARDRLTGSLRSYPAHQEILELLGRVCYQMGDLPEAAKYWYLTELDGPELAEAIDALHRRYGHGKDGLARALPVMAAIDDYPPAVARRLEDISRDVKWAGLAWKRKGRESSGLPPMTIPERVKEASLVGLVLLLTVGVWIAGLLAILAFIFGWDA